MRNKRQIHTYLPPDVVEEIQASAKKRGESLAEWLRAAVHAKLEQERKSGTNS